MIQAKQWYESLKPRDFAEGEAIEIGAVVEVERGRERTVYFVGAFAGGTEVVCEGIEVVVITPVSPMGRVVMGRRQGEVAEVSLGGKKEKYRLVRVE
jgi:transcription elongation GreA/GreB family factor